jgi:hypothetical protein
MACDNSIKPTTNEINTETCVAPTCIPPLAPVCAVSQCQCGCNPCTCGGNQVASPTPFYNQACGVQEDHTKVLNTQTFITTVSTASAFNMPTPGNIVTGIVIPGLQTIQIGAYLWNVKYGYIRVLSFDSSTGTISITNDGYPGNASVGTLVPACTVFNVVDPPCVVTDECDSEHSYITQDFIVPNVGTPINVAVSNLLGILVTRNVQIGTGIYKVTAIVDIHTITILNEGAGDAPGITVFAKDTLGHCISPVTAFSDDPCAKTAELDGKLVICRNGITTTLEATAKGQIPVCKDAATNEVQFETLAIPTNVCSFLDACLNLVDGVLTYTIVVRDVVGFNIEDIIYLNYLTLTNYQWVITAINGPIPNPPSLFNVLQITIESVSGVQSLDATVPVDTQVCAAPCCEQILYKVGPDGVCNRDWHKAFKNTIDIGYTGNEVGVITPLMLWVGTEKSITITNDTCNDMVVAIDLDYVFEGHFNVDEGDWAATNFEPWYGYDVVPIGSPHAVVTGIVRSMHQDHVFGIGPGHNYGWIIGFGPYDSPWNNSYHGKALYTIAAGMELQANAHLRLYYFNHKFVKIDGAINNNLKDGLHCDKVTCDLSLDPTNVSPTPTHNLTIDSAAVAIYAHGIAVQAS